VGSSGVALRYTADTWEKVHDGIDVAVSLTGVWGSSSKDIFAVGGALTTFLEETATPEHVVYHFDGAQWTVMKADANEMLLDVWGSGPADVFAVGGLGTILHYDGKAWSPMPSGVADVLHAVWGSGPTDVFAVGDSSTILHYDGSGWSKLALGGGPEDGFAYFTDVWGTGPDDVYGLADHGRIFHYDGAAWTWVELGDDESLESLHGSGPDDIFAVGADNRIFHYDGSSWSPVRAAGEPPIGAPPTLRAVWTTPTEVFFAGEGGRLAKLTRFEPW
jgi:hypothetical protein